MDVTAKLSSKAQAVLPREVRRKLDLKPGDTIRFRETEQGIVIERAALDLEGEHWGDPFATFTEWASPEEDDAWKDL